MSIFGVVKGEPSDRLSAVLHACESQDWPGAIELVLAAPPGEVARTTLVASTWRRGPTRVVSNPGGRRTTGLNRAVAASTGDVVVRVDARSRLSIDHVRRVVARLESRPDVGVAGGVQRATPPPGAGTWQQGIALALRNRWMLGGAAYRRPGSGGPVDTVYLGAFRRRELVEIRYDESLDANEDFEICERYRAGGAVVWLERDLVVDYEPRSDLRTLSTQYRAFGRAKVLMWRRTGRRPNGRQFFALGLAGVGAVLATTQLAHPVRLVAGALVVPAVYLATDTPTAVELEQRRLSVRLASVVAHAVIHASWLTGIIEGVGGKGATPSSSGGRSVEVQPEVS